MIIDLDAHLIDKRALQISQRFELFSPHLTPTFVKLDDIVSLLTNFSELKFDHIFYVHLDDKRARQISRCSELFSAPISQTLTKLYDGVSLLTYFLEWKLDHRFGWPLDKQSCTPNFAMFRAIILTPFKANCSETAREFHF